MKKLLITALAAFGLLGATAYADTIEITIDSPVIYTLGETLEKKELEAAAYIADDITMVPMRFVSEQLGGEVEWDEAAQTVTCKKGDSTIVLTVGSKTASVTTAGKTAEKTLLSAPVIVNDRTMVPLRVISEGLGAYVEWVAPTRQVIITDDAAAATVNGVRVDVALIDTFYELYQSNVQYYGEELYFDMIYSEAIRWASFEQAWKIINPNITLPQEYVDEINAIPAEQLENLGLLKSYLVKYQLMSYALIEGEGFFQKSISEADINTQYTENYMCANHILVSTINQQTGESLSDAEKAQAKAKAKELLAAAKAGDAENFRSMVAEYSDDAGKVSNPDGYLFTTGEMISEFESAVLALGENEISDIVESVYGYHIILRQPLPALTDSTRSAIISALINNYAEVMISGVTVESVTPYADIFEAVNAI